MKKSKLLILGLIALMLIGGLMLASCGLRECDAGKCGRLVGNCGQNGTNGCSALLGGNMSCSDACGGS